jgi:hypothetical protein
MADGRWPDEAEARNSKVPCPTDLKSQVPLPSPLSSLDTKPASSLDAEVAHVHSGFSGQLYIGSVINSGHIQLLNGSNGNGNSAPEMGYRHM